MARARMAMVSHLIHPLLFVLLSFFFFTNIFKMNYRFSLRTSDSTITKKMWCTLHKHTRTQKQTSNFTNTDNCRIKNQKAIRSNIYDITSQIFDGITHTQKVHTIKAKAHNFTTFDPQKFNFSLETVSGCIL